MVLSFFCVGLGNGLMDEEFREWVQRIQSVQEETISPSTTSAQTDSDDDITQDLIAAFRWAIKLSVSLPFNMLSKIRSLTHVWLFPFMSITLQYILGNCIDYHTTYI